MASKKVRLFERQWRHWLKHLGIEWWDLFVVPQEKLKDGDSDEFTTLAEAHTDWRYQRARVDVSVPALEAQGVAVIPGLALHEAVHVVQNPLKQCVDEIILALPKAQRKGYQDYWHSVNEAVTEHWAHTLLRLHGEPESIPQSKQAQRK